MELESTFVQQFTGSASANLAFGLIFLVYMGLKKLCERESRCKSKCHLGCIDLDVTDVTRRSPTVPPELRSEV